MEQIFHILKFPFHEKSAIAAGEKRFLFAHSIYPLFTGNITQGL